MKKNLLLLIVCCLATMVHAQQPYTGCYHPEDVKNWVAGEDPNDIFSKGTITLQERFVDESIKANPNSTFSDALVAPDLTLSKDCSKGYAQGRNTFDEMYTFNYWQYVDMVIWWGGSAGEGVFICPTGSAIDAAHKNGVKILGNIFFAPGTFGGQSSWVTETLEKDASGNYIIADKLIEMADYFGFDGWFLNEETNHFGAQSEWENFCAYFSANSDLELQMYNATSSFGNGQKWMLRNSAGEETGTSYFVDYGGTSGVDSYVSYAESIGAEKSDLFFGVNQGTSAFAGNGDISRILAKDNHKASLAPFMERVTWRVGNNDDQYDLGKDHIHSFFRYANKYWVGSEQPNPEEDRAGKAWSGMASYIPARTFIQSKPFVTTFNSGYGIRRNVKGEDKGVTDQKWVHQGMQDILPTWRWWWQDAANKELSCELTLDEAYESGTCLKVEGSLNANDANEVRLYKTKIAIENADVFKLVFKNSIVGSSNLQVGLAFAEDNNAFSYISAGNATGGWDVKELDLSAYAGKTLSMISLKYESASALTNFTSFIGELGVLGGTSLSCTGVSNVSIQKELGVENGDIRLTWDVATGDVLHYNVYLEQSGSKKLVGQTPSNAFYIPEITRTDGSESGVKVYVTSVAKDFEESTESSTDINWGAVSLPDVKIKASSTFAVSGTEITFAAVASNYPTSYAWTKPEGAEVVSQSGNTAVFRFPTEGVYNVSVSVTNLSGTTDCNVEGLVTINNTDVLANVALNKSIADHNGHFGSETPERLIDGVIDQGGNAKWCFGGEMEHFVIIDLEQAYMIYNTRLFDCKVNENANNLKCYKTYVSTDNSEGSWVELFDEQDREADDIKIEHFKGTVGRYVKLVPYDQDDKVTIRLWEFEVYGMAGPLSIDEISAMVSDKEMSNEVTLNFDLGDQVKEDNFSIEIAPLSSEDESLINISDIVIEASSVKFNVNTVAYGEAKYAVTLTNGVWSASSVGKVAIVDPNAFSILPFATETKALALIASDGSIIKDHTSDVGKAIDGDNGTYIDYKYSGDHVPVIHTFEFSYDKSYDLNNLEMWFKGGTYPKAPKEIKVMTSTDGSVWAEAATFTPDGLKVDWALTETVSSKMFKIDMHYADGYDDECELLEIIAIGKVTDVSTAIGTTIGSSFEVGVSPNPVVDQANVALNLVKAGKVTIDIFNIVGAKEAQAFNGELSAGTHVLPLNSELISGLNSGIYIVVVTTPEGKKTIKISKK